MMDKTVKDITDGHYQYGVELEVQDGSFKEVLNTEVMLTDRAWM